MLRQIVYAGREDGLFGIFRRNADGTGVAERLTRHDTALFPTTFAPDGKTLVGHVPAAGGSLPVGIYAIDMTADHTPRPLAGTARSSANAQISSDGRWIAYETSESGRSEVVVQSYPNLNGGRWQISSAGGSQPVFSRSAGELYYRDTEGRLVAMTLQFAPFTVGRPTVLFESVFSPGSGRPYDLSRDGRFLLINEQRVQWSGTPPQLNLVLNWVADLRGSASASK